MRERPEELQQLLEFVVIRHAGKHLFKKMVMYGSVRKWINEWNERKCKMCFPFSSFSTSFLKIIAYRQIMNIFVFYQQMLNWTLESTPQTPVPEHTKTSGSIVYVVQFVMRNASRQTKMGGGEQATTSALT